MKRKDTKMNIKIEKMTLDDFEQIKDRLTDEFDNFWSPTMLKQELENKQNLNSHYFVAKVYSSYFAFNDETKSIPENKLWHKDELLENNISAEEIVGFIGITIVLDEANIMNIVVKKNKRNLGIGSLLLEEIINFVKSNNAFISYKVSSILSTNAYDSFNIHHSSNESNINISSIILEVNEKNIPAIRLYKKYGFKQIGLRKKYYNNSDNAIIMSLSI